MAKWEYVRLLVASTQQGRPPVFVSASSNMSRKFNATDSLDDCLTGLGNDGWELAGVLGDASRAQLLFKRPHP